MTLNFPEITPSSRSVSVGDWPQQKVQAQSGEETRILYGDKKSGITLTLVFKNILDTSADDFFLHYDQQKGTYSPFGINDTVKAGWGGHLDSADSIRGGGASDDLMDAGHYGNKWRYAGPPQYTQTTVGRSTVQVKLISVL